MTQDSDTIPVEIRVGDQHYEFEVTRELLRVSPESAANYIAAKAKVIAEIAAEKL